VETRAFGKQPGGFKTQFEEAEYRKVGAIARTDIFVPPAFAADAIMEAASAGYTEVINNN